MCESQAFNLNLEPVNVFVVNVFDYTRNVLQFDNDLQAFKNVIPNSLYETILKFLHLTHKAACVT